MPTGVYVRTQEHNKKVSLANLGKKRSLVTRGRMKVSNSRVFTIESRKKMSESAMRRVLKLGPKTYSLGKAQWFTDRLGRRMFLRSSYELQFAQFLDSRLITWEYQPRYFLETDGIHRRLPDFHVKDLSSYIEIKPWFRIDEAYDLKRLLECVYRVSLLVVSDYELGDLDSWWIRVSTA